MKPRYSWIRRRTARVERTEEGMPRLYCEKHGLEYEVGVVEDEQVYRREGETILIVRGILRSGPWLCDRCNTTLGKGMPACLASFLPAWITAQAEAYDFAYEREYFAMHEATVVVRGAPWAAITPGSSGDRISFQEAPPRRRRPREPLCALDLFSEKPNG
jgi:hypothetical protein